MLDVLVHLVQFAGTETEIYEREQQLGSLEKELANTKGVFKGKQRKEWQEQIR